LARYFSCGVLQADDVRILDHIIVAETEPIVALQDDGSGLFVRSAGAAAEFTF
jgi:hypothetical protein